MEAPGIMRESDEQRTARNKRVYRDVLGVCECECVRYVRVERSRCVRKRERGKESGEKEEKICGKCE